MSLSRHLSRCATRLAFPWLCIVTFMITIVGLPPSLADEPVGGQDTAAAAQPAETEGGSSGGFLFTNSAGEPLENVVDRVFLSGSARIRPEYTSDFLDFDSDLDDEFDFVTARFRLGLGVDVKGDMGFFVEGQTNNLWGNDGLFSNFDFSGEDDFSLYQGYFELRSILGSQFTLRAGRQELVYGNELLLGDADFGPGISHDGVKVMFEGDPLSVHAWWSRVVESANFTTVPGPGAGTFDPLDEDVDFFGVYSMLEVAEGTGLDGYWLFFRNPRGPVGASVSDEVHTLGVRAYHTLPDVLAQLPGNPDLVLDGEFAWQAGNSSVVGSTDRNIRAFAFEAGATLNFKDALCAPRLKMGYAFASGDSDPTDSSSDTFRPLFQDNHPRLGYSDFLALTNIHALTTELVLQAHEMVGVGAGYYAFWVNRPEDTTSPSGTVPAGFTADDNHFLGHEINLFFNILYNDNFSAQLAWAHLIPGTYIKNQFASRSDADRLYLHMTFVF